MSILIRDFVPRFLRLPFVAGLTPSPRYGISNRRFPRYRLPPSPHSLSNDGEFSFSLSTRRSSLIPFFLFLFLSFSLSLPLPLCRNHRDTISSGDRSIAFGRRPGSKAIIAFVLSPTRDFARGRGATESPYPVVARLAFSASSALKYVINCRRKSAYRSRTLRRVLNSPGFTRARRKKFPDCPATKKEIRKRSRRAKRRDTRGALLFFPGGR